MNSFTSIRRPRWTAATLAVVLAVGGFLVGRQSAPDSTVQSEQDFDPYTITVQLLPTDLPSLGVSREQITRAIAAVYSLPPKVQTIKAKDPTIHYEQCQTISFPNLGVTVVLIGPSENLRRVDVIANTDMRYSSHAAELASIVAMAVRPQFFAFDGPLTTLASALDSGVDESRMQFGRITISLRRDGERRVVSYFRER